MMNKTEPSQIANKVLILTLLLLLTLFGPPLLIWVVFEVVVFPGLYVGVWAMMWTLHVAHD